MNGGRREEGREERGREGGREREREGGRERGREKTEVFLPVVAGILRALLGRGENESGAVHRHLGGSSM